MAGLESPLRKHATGTFLGRGFTPGQRFPAAYKAGALYIRLQDPVRLGEIVHNKVGGDGLKIVLMDAAYFALPAGLPVRPFIAEGGEVVLDVGAAVVKIGVGVLRVGVVAVLDVFDPNTQSVIGVFGIAAVAGLIFTLF